MFGIGGPAKVTIGTGTVRTSIPKPRTVRGYEIKRLPLGPMLDAIEGLQELPGELLQICFPGKDPGEILQQLKAFDVAMLMKMIENAMIAAPKHILHVFSELSGVPEKALLEDPDIGLDGAAELMAAWLEVCGIENFIKAARVLTAKVKSAAGSFRLPKTGPSA